MKSRVPSESTGKTCCHQNRTKCFRFDVTLLFALHKWQCIKSVTQISNTTRVTGTEIKRSHILKISLLNFDADNTTIFLSCQPVSWERSPEKKRKPIHFRPVKTVRSNMVIRLRLHGKHSKGNTPEYRLCGTRSLEEETTLTSRLPRRIQNQM